MTGRSPTRVEPLGTGELMPALLVGFGGHVPSAEDSVWQRVAESSGVPPWLVHVEQQAGGMSMFYPEALGVLLRFAANAEHALKSPGHLLAGFHCMAEDPQLDVLQREHPHLRPLCHTWGEAYNVGQLQHLVTAVSPYFHLPLPSSGHEAFVEYQDCDPLAYVDGWRVVEAVGEIDVIETEQLEYGALWRDASCFDADLLTRLRDIGSVAVPGSPLRMFLLWENCD